ncbi:MAG: flagellar export chaperone FlgN [Selenomonadaceae bacterium]|nr:flagellar export chaperone FlgN [Selenomonadaceae bacterium]
MDETIKILREQIILCSRLPELLDELIKIMRENSPEVQEPIRKIETVMRELSENEKKAQTFLKRVKAKNFSEYLAAQKKNIQRDMAEKLLKKSAEVQSRIKTQSEELKMLLQNGKKFVEFNLNILSKTSASETYGNRAQRDSQRTRRIFDANV